MEGETDLIRTKCAPGKTLSNITTPSSQTLIFSNVYNRLYKWYQYFYYYNTIWQIFQRDLNSALKNAQELQSVDEMVGEENFSAVEPDSRSESEQFQQRLKLNVNSSTRN